MNRIRGVAVAAAAALALGLGACSGSDEESPDPGPVISDSATGPTPSPAKQTPRKVTKDQQFSFDDTAKFADGLQIEIAGTLADKAKKTDRGAEATQGQIVIASVRIENDTHDPYDASDVLISASYGGGVDAQIIIDSTNELQSGFDGSIAKGDEAVATVGFAIPISGLKHVTYVVDPNDDVHDPVSFTGEVEQT